MSRFLNQLEAEYNFIEPQIEVLKGGKATIKSMFQKGKENLFKAKELSDSDDVNDVNEVLMECVDEAEVNLARVQALIKHYVMVSTWEDVD